MPSAVEEIAELERQRVNAFNEGDLDAWMAMYAENAVHTASTIPFWIEGKDAIPGGVCGPLSHLPHAPSYRSAALHSGLQC
jgi:ketosteroid isomerase-like protein